MNSIYLNQHRTLMKNQFLISLLLFGFFSMYSQSETNTTVIRAGGLVDIINGKVDKDVVVVIENGIITKINKGSEKNQYNKVIDLSEYTLLPGLIDCHTHLIGNWYDEAFDPYELPAASYGILGTVNAKKTLEAGFTTVRDLHSYFYGDVALRDAINRDWIPGPRMYVSGPGLTITGGHGAMGNWLSPQMAFSGNLFSIADGEDEVRKETRKHLKYKVDWIKIFATGGFSSYGTIPGAASYTVEELKAAVDEAKKLGIHVAAHAHGADGIKNALKSGVRSIEHAVFIDKEAIELLLEKEAYLSMDLLSAYYDLFEKRENYNDKKIDLDNNEMYKSLASNFNKAYKQGVKMVFGSDSGVYPHGRNAEQFKLMTDAGMREIDAIRSATSIASELLGLTDKLGTISVGKWADIIAVKGDPLRDITVLENVAFVMKGGKVYKSPK